MTATEDANKAFVIEAFDTLFNRRDYAAAEAFWSPDYIQHSAHIAPGRSGLFDLVRSLPPELRYEHQLVVADGDHVMLHGRFSGHGLPANWVVVDVVRIADGKLAEHWDVIQDEVGRDESQSGLPMFGDTFPRRDHRHLRRCCCSRSSITCVVDPTTSIPRAPGASTTAMRRWRESSAVRPVSVASLPSLSNHWSVRSSAPSCTSTAAATSAALPRIDTCRSPAPSRSPRAPECTPSITAWLPNIAFPPPSRTASPPIGGPFEEGGADPQTVAVLGDSAGGNLAVAVAVATRDEGLSLPSCVAVISPFADLMLSGASMELRKDGDPYVTRELLESMAAEYLDGADPADPRCSSVFADLRGLPPLLIQVGEDEILFDDAARIRDAATAAGVDTTFAPWIHGIHVWPVYISAGLPESALAIEELAAFLKARS